MVGEQNETPCFCFGGDIPIGSQILEHQKLSWQVLYFYCISFNFSIMQVSKQGFWEPVISSPQDPNHDIVHASDKCDVL